jgi:hypothetical protein
VIKLRITVATLEKLIVDGKIEKIGKSGGTKYKVID